MDPVLETIRGDGAEATFLFGIAKADDAPSLQFWAETPGALAMVKARLKLKDVVRGTVQFNADHAKFIFRCETGEPDGLREALTGPLQNTVPDVIVLGSDDPLPETAGAAVAPTGAVAEPSTSGLPASAPDGTDSVLQGIWGTSTEATFLFGIAKADDAPSLQFWAETPGALAMVKARLKLKDVVRGTVRFREGQGLLLRCETGEPDALRSAVSGAMQTLCPHAVVLGSDEEETASAAAPEAPYASEHPAPEDEPPAPEDEPPATDSPALAHAKPVPKPSRTEPARPVAPAAPPVPATAVMPAGWSGGPVLAIPAWLPVEGVVAVLSVGERPTQAPAQAASNGPAPATIEVLLKKLDVTSGDITSSIPRLNNLINEPGQKERIAAVLTSLEQSMNLLRRSLGIPEPVPGPIRIVEKGTVRIIHVPLIAPKPPPPEPVEGETAEGGAASPAEGANPAEGAKPAEGANPADAPETGEMISADSDDELDIPLARELLATIVPVAILTAKKIVPGAKKMRDYARSNLWSDFIPDPTPLESALLIGQTWRKLERIHGRRDELSTELREDMTALHRSYADAIPGLTDSLAPSLSALVDVENRLNHFAGYRKAMTASQIERVDKNMPIIRQIVATHRKLLEMLTPPAGR